MTNEAFEGNNEEGSKQRIFRNALLSVIYMLIGLVSLFEPNIKKVI